MARFEDIYHLQVVPQLKKRFGYSSAMGVPKLEKIVVSMGVGKAVAEKKHLDEAIKAITMITGQKPLICKAKKSVSNFKLREGMAIGCKVTLRKKRMYEFMDRLVSLAIPRVRDFRGLNPKGFDGRGNYSMGLTEQSVFPEVNPVEIEVPQGMDITFVTTARTDEEGKEMLRLFGMPLREE
ncbi:MAG: 50S ribosomal protein L5 [Planctomycetota bacterium]